MIKKNPVIIRWRGFLFIVIKKSRDIEPNTDIGQFHFNFIKKSEDFKHLNISYY
jgi:hypothetical protein